MSWNSLTGFEKDEYLRRRDTGTPISVLAEEIDIPENTLRGRLSEWRNRGKAADVQFFAVEERRAPSNEDLYQILRKGPISLAELSRKFDRSEDTIRSWLENMEHEGYVIEETRQSVEISKQAPKVDFAPTRTLADEAGQEISIAWASDAHFGSSHAQVSARKRFIEMAYHEYGVRHLFDPGDLTCGVYGYRGQEWDMIPAIRPGNRIQAAATTQAEIWLANNATPQLPGLQYYVLGGNHDYWHIVNTGIDAIGMYCKQRDDSFFLGYDVADVPLTDRVSIRMWHPSGGVPYSLSYRLQKGLEQVAFDELTRAVEENDNPKVRILLAGHLHVEVKFHRGPMVGILAGCFEGQTNYLKRKALYPTIGGGIAQIRLSDSGLIQRFNYTFVPYIEVEDDWKNFLLPPNIEPIEEPDRVEALFQLAY